MEYLNLTGENGRDNKVKPNLIQSYEKMIEEPTISGMIDIKKSAKDATTLVKNIYNTELLQNEMEIGQKKENKKVNPINQLLPNKPKTNHKAKLKELIEKADKEVKELHRIANENKNTKNEIKNYTNILRGTMRQIMTCQIQALLNEDKIENEVMEEVIQKTEIETQTDFILESQINNGMKTAATQTEVVNHEVKNKRRWETLIEQEDLKAIVSLKQFEEIRSKKWSEEVYTKVNEIVGNPLSLHTEGCTLIITEDMDLNLDEYIQKKYKERFPDLSEMTAPFETMENIIKRKQNDQETEKKQYIIKVITDGSIRDMWDKMNRVKIFTEENKIDKITTHRIRNMETDIQRKILQTIFNNGQTTIDLFVPKKLGITDVLVETEKNTFKTKRNKELENTDAIVISQRGKTYPELLKTVKNTIADKPETVKKIQLVRQTKDGKLLIVVDKDETESTKDEIIKMLKPETGNDTEFRITQRTKERQKTVYIKNIDNLTTKEEVIEALITELGEWKVTYKLSNLRPYLGCNQAITAILPENEAKILVNKRFIKIGLNRCQTYERVTIIKCYRCWGYGHVATDCQQKEDRSKLCWNCGNLEHKANECLEEKQCATCGKPGHRAGEGICIKFRQALRMAQRESRMKTTSEDKELHSDKEDEYITN